MAIIPILKQDVAEKTTCWITAAFTDRNGDASIPTSLTYRIDDQESGTAIKAETSVTPASSVDIKVSPTENRILNSANEYETREVTIHAEFGVDDEQNSSMLYRVINLQFLS